MPTTNDNMSSALKEFRLEKFGRFGFSADGKRIRYTALDPADEATECKCGKPGCFAANLFPFREHIARLYRAIAACEQHNRFAHDGWDRVLYPLQMAAAIDDVHADSGFVDDSDSVTYCSSAADFDAAQTEMASKYTAAASIFSFLWMGYESAVQASQPHVLKGVLKDGRLGERGRRLVDEYSELFPGITGLPIVVRFAERLCERGKLFDARLTRIRSKISERKMVFGAELAREFRNFVVHGEDEVPQHDAWDWGGPLGQGTARIHRFYAVGRLLLLLIQAHASAAITTKADPIGHGTDDDGETLFVVPRELLADLHLIAK